jgi:hypothetical protein
MISSSTQQEGKVEIFCPYITVKGKRIYPKKAKFFHFWVDAKKAA